MKLIKSLLLVSASAFLLSVSCKKELSNKKPQVEVGGDTTIQLPVNSVYLTGAVTDPDDKVVTLLWSKISGAGSPTIESPTSLNTWVRELEVGDYYFQLTATDSKGATSSDTVMVTVLTDEAIVVNIQPHNNPTEVHLFGNNTGLDQTDPNAPEILGGSGSFEGTLVDIRALLQFDLSSIPGNATIVSAKLTLYSNPDPLNGHNNEANSGTNNSIFIQRVTSAWDPATANWTNQPTVTNVDQVSIAHTDEGFLDLENIDVTALISGMLSESANHGFLIRLQQEEPYNFRIFCSSKFSNQTKHPKLEVSYTE